jgi:hypothetical protein
MPFFVWILKQISIFEVLNYFPKIILFPNERSIKLSDSQKTESEQKNLIAIL